MVVTLLLLVGSLFTYAGYRLAAVEVDGQADSFASSWRSDVDRQQQEIESLKYSMNEHMDALAIRLGETQAQVIRLDALGLRLTELAGLEDGEFDFKSMPAQGGPAAAGEGAISMASADFLQLLGELEQQIEDREQQLTLLETMLMSQNQRKEHFPAGRPIEKGWLSSHFGKRTDPFTGKQEMHKGLDFAGKKGSNVVAVAAGVVTWSGDRYGYGKMVEINHGGGYVTRYGHGQENLVEVGDRVEQGQAIALMGSSGRSTGPHVHFEVHKKGREVDPTKYVNVTR